ncbi:MAG TPA: TonB family protein [Chryseosolibacter sp.]|nr:TonB family protein [Chryseosolibacter sp.]
MADLNNDIERYLRGELTPAEMNALEQKALNDPFLAEALEGAAHAGPENFAVDLSKIKESLKKKTKKRTIITIERSWQWYAGIAASFLLLALSTFTVITMMKEQQRNLAQSEAAESLQKEAKPTPASADSVKDATKTEAPSRDSLIALNERSAVNETDVVEETEITRPREEVATRSGATRNRAREEAPQALEPVVNNETQTREREREVAVNLSEPPIIVRDEDVAEEEIAEGEYIAETPAVQSEAAKKSFGRTVTRTLKGKVTDDTGTALPGVNVVVKGTTTGTVTNVSGEYEITLPQNANTLVFAFIGLQTQELSIVDNPPALNVTMDPDVTQLSEVVVTGMGVEKSEPVYPTFEMASPEGGRKAFNRYLEDNLKYPQEARDKKMEGKVTVEFTVQPNGTLADFKVIRGIGAGCDEELIRLIKQGPSWTPSKKNNVAISDQVRVRLKFELP